MFSTATRTLLLCISLSAFVVNEVMAKKKEIDLAGQYFSTYSYYETGIDAPRPGATYQTFSTVDALTGIYEWRECYCFVYNGNNNVAMNEGTATLLDDKTGDYRVNVKLSETMSSIYGGFTYIGRKTKSKKNKLQYSLQSFFYSATFRAVAKGTEVELDDDACPVDEFATNCGLEE